MGDIPSLTIFFVNSVFLLISQQRLAKKLETAVLRQNYDLL